jgi:ketosteroid isomerase-like protein
VAKSKGKASRDVSSASVAKHYWESLAAKDADEMAACYASDATFEDEVFRLRGAECGMMWRMLFQGAADLRIRTHDLKEGDGVAHGTWEAWYTFTATGRPVHNRITSRFVIRDGKIVDHKDTFPFYKWSRRALGAKGWFLGWTPLVRMAVRKQARKRLDKWMKEQG